MVALPMLIRQRFFSLSCGRSLNVQSTALLLMKMPMLYWLILSNVFFA